MGFNSGFKGLTFNNCTLCPHCIYVLYLSQNKQRLVPLTAWTDWFFYNRDEKFLLRGTDWVFNQSSLRFVFKGLIQLSCCCTCIAHEVQTYTQLKLFIQLYVQIFFFNPRTEFRATRIQTIFWRKLPAPYQRAKQAWSGHYNLKDNYKIHHRHYVYGSTCGCVVTSPCNYKKQQIAPTFRPGLFLKQTLNEWKRLIFTTVLRIGLPFSFPFKKNCSIHV